MHDEILSQQQVKLLPLVGGLSSELGLVGGTAIALQIGHRRSIDFDLASLVDFNSEKMKEFIRHRYAIESTLVDEANEVSIVVNSVKLTVFRYPFNINFSVEYEDFFNMADILTLGVMKAFALGRRAKWKDYVDLFFIFRQISLNELTDKARDIFKNEFNEKLFREQLSYFEDIDYSETIDYMKGFETNQQEIKNTLREISLQKR